MSVVHAKEGRQCFAYERSSATDHRPSNTLTHTHACKSNLCVFVSSAIRSSLMTAPVPIHVKVVPSIRELCHMTKNYSRCGN